MGLDTASVCVLVCVCASPLMPFVICAYVYTFSMSRDGKEAD